jgi:hypothetical protein
MHAGFQDDAERAESMEQLLGIPRQMPLSFRGYRIEQSG